MDRPRPPSPRFQRSRSGAPRLSHVPSSLETAPAFSSSNLPRSKSVSKSRPCGSSSDDRRKPPPAAKENRRESPPPQPDPRRPKGGGGGRVQSAWALSPGRSPAASAAASPPAAERRKGGGVLGFLRKRREPSAREEAAHRIRMASARLVQWRFVNARAEAAMEAARSSAEKKLFFAWLRINELRNIVAAKRVMIQRRRHKWKLARILNPHIHLLNQWEPVAKSHFDVMLAMTRALQAMCSPLPLIEGAKANTVLIHKYMRVSVETILQIEDAVGKFFSQVERVGLILTEMVETIQQEIEGLEELMMTSKRINSLQMYESSLRAHLIQARSKEEAVVPPTAHRVSRLAYRQLHQHQWHLGLTMPVLKTQLI